MLRSEIIELENSVGAILNDQSTATHNSYQQLLAEQVRYVKNLCADLKKKWTHEFLSSAKEQVIKRYVQFHQAGIIQLSDRVTREVPVINLITPEKEEQLNPFLEVLAELSQVLDFLRRHFYQYFDIDHKTTDHYCRQVRQKIAAFEPDLNKVDELTVDGSLIRCVLVSVDEIISEGMMGGISYRQADQCLNIVRMVHQLLYFGTNTTTEVLLKALYQQNLNSLHFYNWYRAYISLQIDRLSGQTEQSKFIDEQINALAQIFILPEKAIQPELASINSLILPWLQEQTNTEHKRTNGKPPATQFPLNLSVPQFALFTRICYKTGCFPVENVAMITRFFTEHFTTKKQDHISPKSFGRAFYNLDQSAAAVVRDFLQRMLNYLNKTYFP